MDWIGFIPAMQAKMNASIAHMFETHYKQVIESVQSRGMKVDSLILTGTFPFLHNVFWVIFVHFL